MLATATSETALAVAESKTTQALGIITGRSDEINSLSDQSPELVGKFIVTAEGVASLEAPVLREARRPGAGCTIAGYRRYPGIRKADGAPIWADESSPEHPSDDLPARANEASLAQPSATASVWPNQSPSAWLDERLPARLEFFLRELKDTVRAGNYVLTEEADDLLDLVALAGRLYWREMGVPTILDRERTLIVMQRVNVTSGWQCLMPVMTNARIDPYDGTLSYAVGEVIYWRPDDLVRVNRTEAKVLSVMESASLGWVLAPSFS